jgi:hypothetical protein
MNGIIFIGTLDADAIDAVNHEYAHALMYQGYLGSFPSACPGQPWINDAFCETFGWTEGWAYFFPLVVTPDGVYDFHPSGPYQNHCNIEVPSANRDSLQWGPGCPGRVAGALLDLWDTNNDGMDQNSASPVNFATIYRNGIQSHRDSTFCEFWSYLRNNRLSSQQVTLGINSIANNTIYCPCISCGDANNDGSINIADAVFLISYIFKGAAAPASCKYAFGMGDANGDHGVDIADAVYLISYIFKGGASPHCGVV